jgi:hypothetical protein
MRSQPPVYRHVEIFSPESCGRSVVKFPSATTEHVNGMRGVRALPLWSARMHGRPSLGQAAAGPPGGQPKQAFFYTDGANYLGVAPVALDGS